MLRFFPIIVMLSTCGPDETLTGYGDPQATYILTSLNSAPFSARATLRLTDPGRISGDAPCNSYTARQTAPYPWFDAGPIAATRMACPDLAAETAFFAALEAAEFAEAQGGLLILSDSAGGELVFQSQ